MKKIFACVAACAMAVCLFACSSSEETAETDANTTETTATEEQEVKEEVSENNSNYVVEIGECTVIQDYEGNPTLAVEFTWTNNSDEATSFDVAIYDQAFQDGIQLDTTFNSDIETSDSFKDIKPGTTQTITELYALSSETEVTVECTELISFDNTILATKTFSIA